MEVNNNTAERKKEKKISKALKILRGAKEPIALLKQAYSAISGNKFDYLSTEGLQDSIPRLSLMLMISKKLPASVPAINDFKDELIYTMVKQNTLKNLLELVSKFGDKSQEIILGQLKQMKEKITQNIAEKQRKELLEDVFSTYLMNNIINQLKPASGLALAIANFGGGGNNSGSDRIESILLEISELPEEQDCGIDEQPLDHVFRVNHELNQQLSTHIILKLEKN